MLGPAYILLGCLAFVLLRRQWQSLRFLLDPLGILLFLACAGGWIAAAYHRYPPYLFDLLHQHFGRYQGDYGVQEGHFYYVYQVLLLLLPWTPLAIAAVWIGRRRFLREPFWQFALCWTLPGLLLLCTSAYQAKHYLISLLPPWIAIAAPILWASGRAGMRWRRGYHVALAALLAVGCAAGVATIAILRPMGCREIVVLVCLLAAGLLAAIWFEHRRQYWARLAAIFATAWAISVGAVAFVLPHFDTFRQQTDFARRVVNREVPPGEPLYLLGTKESQIIFYLNALPRRLDEEEEFPVYLCDRTKAVYVIVPEMFKEDIARLGSSRLLGECNYVRGGERCGSAALAVSLGLNDHFQFLPGFEQAVLVQHDLEAAVGKLVLAEPPETRRP